MDDNCDKNDETILIKDVEHAEEIIKEGIYAIRKSCSRPSYKNILSYVNGSDEFNLNMPSLKKIMNSMIEKDIIYMKGKKGSESFYVTENSGEDPQVSELNKLENVNFLENFINDQFYKVIVNKVKDDVLLHLTENNLLNAKVEHLMEQRLLSAKVDKLFESKGTDLLFTNNKNIDDINTNDVSPKCKNKTCNSLSTNDVLIDTLNSEIEFLRSELLSKDKIIELILNQLPNGNTCVNKANDFKVTKKSSKPNYSDSSLKNKLTLSNKFSPLNVDTENDVNNVTESRVNKDGNKVVSNKRTVNIIGDSILKDIKPYQLKHKVKKGDKLYVQSYRGARTSAMKHHANASMEFNPDIFILHCGTNDLKLQKSPEEIANNILEIGLQLQSNDNEVFISGIVYRRDELNEKATKVNDILKLKCPNYSLRFIDNSRVISNRHLNQSGLHLSKDGTQLLAENFLSVINT